MNRTLTNGMGQFYLSDECTNAILKYETNDIRIITSYNYHITNQCFCHQMNSSPVLSLPVSMGCP